MYPINLVNTRSTTGKVWKLSDKKLSLTRTRVRVLTALDTSLWPCRAYDTIRLFRTTMQRMKRIVGRYDFLLRVAWRCQSGKQVNDENPLAEITFREECGAKFGLECFSRSFPVGTLAAACGAFDHWHRKQWWLYFLTNFIESQKGLKLIFAEDNDCTWVTSLRNTSFQTKNSHLKNNQSALCAFWKGHDICAKFCFLQFSAPKVNYIKLNWYPFCSS